MNNYRVMKNGIKQESTGYRSLNYSRWHRNLASYCYAYDIDFIEYRANRGIVGIFEIKEFQDVSSLISYKEFVVKQAKNQIKVYRQIVSDKIYHAYFVVHTKDMKYFQVWNMSLYQNPKWIIYDERSYAIWLETL